MYLVKLPALTCTPGRTFETLSKQKFHGDNPRKWDPKDGVSISLPPRFESLVHHYV